MLVKCWLDFGSVGLIAESLEGWHSIPACHQYVDSRASIDYAFICLATFVYNHPFRHFFCIILPLRLVLLWWLACDQAFPCFRPNSLVSVSNSSAPVTNDKLIVLGRSVETSASCSSLIGLITNNTCANAISLLRAPAVRIAHIFSSGVSSIRAVRTYFLGPEPSLCAANI